MKNPSQNHARNSIALPSPHRTNRVAVIGDAARDKSAEPRLA